MRNLTPPRKGVEKVRFFAALRMTTLRMTTLKSVWHLCRYVYYRIQVWFIQIKNRLRTVRIGAEARQGRTAGYSGGIT